MTGGEVSDPSEDEGSEGVENSLESDAHNQEDATEMPEPDGSNGIDHHAPSSIQVLGGTVTGEPPVPSGLIGEQADLTRKYTDDTGDDDDDFKGINSQPDQTETGLTRSIFRAWGIFQGLAYDTVEAWRSLE
ncbi:hypothetical protein M231_02228 [Tremella mesenterica]|uniref:Uncharacterized protein n=1 Tax=Tremella mesenterica TaxID=5217 RepID=A0A4Q1BR11_TREME|nr:hypothetical protein M231_02228 [Tremella mesenterica]